MEINSLVGFYCFAPMNQPESFRRLMTDPKEEDEELGKKMQKRKKWKTRIKANIREYGIQMRQCTK